MVRFALGQIDPKVGDIEGNFQKIAQVIEKAKKKKADLLVLPELSLNGYPPRDLSMRMDFIEKTWIYLEKLSSLARGIGVLVGAITLDVDVRDSAVFLHDGKIEAIYHKRKLPNYSVFDEFRYFKPGSELLVIDTNDGKIGVTVCEDVWVTPGPVEEYSSIGVDLIVNLSASPYHIGKRKFRKDYMRMKAFENSVWIVYVNTVGGQDELVFDGSSMVISPDGKVITELSAFEEDFTVIDVDLKDSKRVKALDSRTRWVDIEPKSVKTVNLNLGEKDGLEVGKLVPDIEIEEELLRAIVLAIRDYVRKNGFEKVVIGLSGGIDSSLVASLAVLALGKENVKGVLMPSMYTSKESMEDAQKLAENLEIETFTIPITNVFKAYENALSQVFKGTQPDVTEENIQARIRGNYLMALSNKFGWLVLTTGNKSEYATGYATLYGDMAGGFAPIKDLYKTDVYRVARHLNEREGREIIPRRVFEKPPSAELRPGQTDQDKLPPYDILDSILKLHIDENRTFDEIVKMGYDERLVDYVFRLVKMSEYKRYQSAPGPKLTPRVFGLDWRMPITNGFLH